MAEQLVEDVATCIARCLCVKVITVRAQESDQLVKNYESVLTDEPFFKGSLQDLQAAATAAHADTNPAPVLRKDFVVYRYQIVEARAYGADAFLLIVAALTDRQLRDLIEYGVEYGLEALVEVHDAEELRRASALGATLIGINNRDLRTFETSLAVSERLAPGIPKDRIVIGESGISAPADLAHLAAFGISTFLVGESLMRSADVAAATRALLAREAPSTRAAG